jgi:hypothetical protein
VRRPECPSKFGDLLGASDIVTWPWRTTVSGNSVEVEYEVSWQAHVQCRCWHMRVVAGLGYAGSAVKNPVCVLGSLGNVIKNVTG